MKKTVSYGSVVYLEYNNYKCHFGLQEKVTGDQNVFYIFYYKSAQEFAVLKSIGYVFLHLYLYVYYMG